MLTQRETRKGESGNVSSGGERGVLGVAASELHVVHQHQGERSGIKPAPLCNTASVGANSHESVMATDLGFGARHCGRHRYINRRQQHMHHRG